MLERRNLTFHPQDGPPALPPSKKEDLRAEGAGRSPGIAMARACIPEPTTDTVPLRRIRPERVEVEIGRLKAATAQVISSLEQIMLEHYDLPDLTTSMADTLNMLRSGTTIHQKIPEVIKKNGWSAAYATQYAFNELDTSISNPFRRDAAFEMRDLKDRLIRELSPKAKKSTDHMKAVLEATPGDKIIIAQELSPAQALLLARPDVKGVVLFHTGAVSHVGMLLQDLGIPYIANIDPVQALGVKQGDLIIIDGDTGWITAKPSQETIEKTNKIIAEQEIMNRKLPLQQRSSVTTDGVRLHISGDLMSLEGIENLNQQRVEGFGLIRTELFLLRADRWLTEQEQVDLYQKILEGASPQVATFRTFDLGDDKMSAGLDSVLGAGAGLRGIRYALSIEREQFKTQLRSLIIAGSKVGNDLNIMFPMVLDADDMRNAKAVFNSAVDELISENKIEQRPTNIKLGAMIETSSVVALIGQILEESDFASVGTNDLLVSMLDGDRNQSTGAHYHPAFLFAARKIMRYANQLGKPVSFCGDMPSRTRNIPLLIGVGARDLVVTGQNIESVNGMISQCSTEECVQIVRQLIKTGGGGTALERYKEFLAEKLPNKAK